jgi:serine/threonine-protein kinase
MSNRSSQTSATPSTPPLSGGRKLGDKFEIVGVLGEGGTGIVYDATRVATGERIALKVIHPHLAGDKQIRGRFTREAAILRRLVGDHLCPILDFGQVDDPRREGAGLLYMALPKIEGEALDAYLKREKTLPLDRAIAIVLEVCAALAEAHAQGVIHRDLKPGNVLLREGEHAIVVDFGMAKIVTGGGGTGTTALTQHNMVFGTPEYMAPEQARGDELDARCDIYAAGVILYELLTGSVPFSGATPLNVLTAHLTASPRPLRDRAPERGISAALEAVVLHAMAKNPARRYPTANALAHAIRRARESPNDVDAVRPAVRVEVDSGAPDPHAETIPAPMPSDQPLPTSSREAPLPAVRRPSGGSPTASPERASRSWTIVWIIAAVVGISVGVWLSLRGN